jgi:Fe-S cluster assembly protein SufD
MAAVAERYESLVAEFEAMRRESAASGPAPSEQMRVEGTAWDARAHAFERFLAKGFPSTRDEEWRFTNVGPIAEAAFMRSRPASPAEAQVDEFRLTGVVAEIVLVNGRVSKALSKMDALPAGVSVRSQAQGPGPKAQGRFTAEGPFVDLNHAFHEDAVQIDIAPKTVVAEPIHILSIAIADGPPSLVLPRLEIHVGEAAEVSFVETFAGLGEGTTLTSSLTGMRVETRAIVHYVKIQRELDSAFHLANIALTLDRASTVTSTALTFGARISRNDILATLAGEGAECTLNGLYVVSGQSLTDTHTIIDHAKAHCPSHEVYKGILGGRARAVFNGKIIVRQDAQKTDAKQTNKALLLTDDAQVNTKPQLEIFADDVKCTHGAAIGQLDEDALFYLQARGIAVPDAKAMLIHAFAGEVIEGIAAPAVREAATALLDARLDAIAAEGSGPRP